MDKHPKSIIDRIAAPGWEGIPNDVRKAFAVRELGDGVLGLFQLTVADGKPSLGYFDQGQCVA